ncbi:MAG: hypothetical protein Q8O46_04120 [bacterium]|nr:hypothetical protein [bacterium]
MRTKKHFFKKFLGFLVLSFLITPFANAVDLTSTNFIIRDPIIGTGGEYGTSTSFKLISAGDKVLTGIGSSTSFVSRYGFLYYPFVTAAVLTAVANGPDANLSWTASTAGQGWTVGGYKTGKSSTVGGPYTYTDVGNVLSSTYSNLAPGDYCFVIQTYDSLSNVITTSNESCITISQVIVFDLDTATGGGNGESSAPYSVALGTVTTTDTRVSGTADAVQMIVIEGNTNATSGVIVTVRNANGTNGVVSMSVSADNINSADGTMADGTENYGLCVATSGLTGFSRASPYNTDTCAVDSETNGVQALTTAGENILNSAGASVTGGHAEIIVNSAVSATTPAHSDYTDTITFIATGTF